MTTKTPASHFLPGFKSRRSQSIPEQTSPGLTQSFDSTESSQKQGRRVSESIEMVKNQYKLDLSLDHNILRAMAHADKEQEALKDNSSLNHGFKRMSAGMRLLRSSQLHYDSISQIKDHLAPFKEKKAEARLRDAVMSQHKWVRTDRERWIKSRGIEPSVQDSKAFKSFLRQLFMALDEDDSGRLSVDELVFPLLAFGLCPEAHYVESVIFKQALKTIFKCPDASKIFIQRDEFENMFKEDSKTDHILHCLDLNSKNSAFKAETKEKITSRCESAPLNLAKDENSIRDKFVYATVEDHVKLLKTWWNGLKTQQDLAHISKVAEFLSEQNLAPNKHEGMRMFRDITSSNYLDYSDFEKIFIKSIFKAALMNLAAGLNNGELDSTDASLRLKISNYQRSLMLKGTSPDWEHKQFKQNLQAICKYQKNQPGFSRNKITVDLKKTVEHVEENHKERMKGYLYKLKAKAKEFINERGDIITSVKNTWDIRDIVSSKYSKNVSTVLEGEKTFDASKYFKKLTKTQKFKVDKPPMPRKIKAFRENYTLEKYQKLIESPHQK